MLDNLPGAVFSEDRQYRYFLQRRIRQWPMESKGTLVGCLLNGSTANEWETDNTLTKMLSYGLSWGYGMFLLVNIFGLAATDPKALYEVDDPVGPDNDWWIDFAASHADLLICGWGNHGTYMDRGTTVGDRLVQASHTLYALEGPDDDPFLTKQSQPRHPLYLRLDRKPKLFRLPGMP